MSSKDLAILYCKHLDEVRMRLKLVLSVVAGRVTAGNEPFNYEIVAVNIRKALELIAFNALSANKAVYSAAHADFAGHWNAKKLIAKLEKLHPEFYPQPVTMKVIDAGPPRQLHFDHLVDGFLTREEFVELYDLCSQVIHTRNPFSEKAEVDFRLSVEDWVSRIETLLKLHLIRLAGAPEIWLSELSAPNDGHAHAYIAGPVSPCP